jgi:hypothetical protein
MHVKRWKRTDGLCVVHSGGNFFRPYSTETTQTSTLAKVLPLHLTN